MIDLSYPFRVTTRCSRRPIPPKYVHLRKFTELVKQFLKITNITELTDINELLNQTANLYVSNEISRVIAQVIGLTDKGFETIKGTEDGELHVYAAAIGAIADAIVAAGATGSLSAKLGRVTQGLEDLKTMIVLATGSTVQIEGTSQTPLKEDINIATATTHDIIAAVSDVKHKITTIVFTVGGDVNVTLRDDDGVFTGAMDFGGTNEPRGFVSNHGQIPMCCGTNKKFQITLSAAVQVSGYVLYYDEA